MIDKKSFYSRQTMMEGIGLENIKRMNDAKILVVGLGGLGCPLALYLANSGVEHLGLIDGDEIDASNLARQILYHAEDIGKKKSDIAKQRLERQNPFAKITSYSESINSENIFSIITDFDIIVDCTDNLMAKFLIHDACFKLRKKLVIGAIYQWSGWIKAFTFEDENAPCLRCLWEDLINDSCIQNCSEVGILPSTCMMLASYMTNEVIKILIDKPHLKDGEDFLIDLLSLQNRKVAWLKNPHCPICSKKREDFVLENYLKISSFEKTFSQLKDINLQSWTLVDIREGSQAPPPFAPQFGQVFHLNKIDDIIKKLGQTKNVILMCYTGKTSYSLTKKLLDKGLKNFYSLKGGAEYYKKY